MCKQEYSSDKSTKIYTIKELVMTETTTSYFLKSLYIPAIQKLAFHLPRVNRYVSIEGIALGHFSVEPQADINSSTLSRLRHAAFHYFLSDNSKQDAATTTAHRKLLISLLKN